MDKQHLFGHLLNLLILVLCIYHGGECCKFGNADGCTYPCHCLSNLECDPDTGSCPDNKCDDGSKSYNFWRGNWSGPGCQIGNVAFGKSATQSGSWNYNEASWAVDGYTSSYLGDHHCAHADGSNSQSWWRVDLGRLYVIMRILLLNRNSYQDRLANVDIHVSRNNSDDWELCGNTDDGIWLDYKDKVSLECPSYLLGRYIKIYNAHDNSLTLCETYIWGYQYEDCPDDSFGAGCLTPCNCDTACDDISGHCAGTCIAGKQGDSCQQDCNPGTWGMNCGGSCNCEDENEECDKQNGICHTSGCKTNYIGPGCSIELPQLDRTSPEVQKVNSNSVEFKIEEWKPNMGGTGPVVKYIIQYKSESESTWTDGVTSPHTGQDFSEVIQTGLISSTLYHLHVVPVIDFDNSRGIPSNAISITTLNETLSPPPRGPSIGTAVGIVISIVVIISLAIFIIIFIRKRRSNPKSKSNSRPEIVIISQTSMNTSNGIINEAFEENSEVAGIPDPPNVAPPLVPNTSQSSDPIYGNQESDKVTLILISELAAYIEGKKNTVDGFKNEYKQLEYGATAEWEIGNRPENVKKNRFLNIRAYDHSRVVLEKEEDDINSDYINANYIPGYKDKDKAYIAAQGARKHTVNDMWRMIWQTECNRIVMLTNLVENSKNKCDRYWPEEGSEIYGNIKVRLISQEDFADYIIRTLAVSLEDESRTVYHFHFIGWSDHGVPVTGTALLAFRKKIRQFDDQGQGPVLVHCSAGVGRTGTFIAIDYQLDKAKEEGYIDVFSFTKVMRQYRINMIQTLDQYVFVYDVLLEAFRSGETAIPCPKFPEEYKKLTAINSDTGKTLLAEQFEVLEILKPPQNSEKTAALESKNIDKNRFQDIIPSNRVRPYLSNLLMLDGKTDYINAVYIDGYKVKNAYIITQMPLPHTVADLWRLVWDHNVRTVIMLNQLEKQDETVGVYWPEEDDTTLTFGGLKVELTNTETDDGGNVTVRSFSVSNAKMPKDGPVIVKQFELHCWPSESALPTSIDTLLDVQERTEKWQQQSGNGPITMHCLNGALRSGLFCGMLYMLEKMKVDQEVDIFHTVKHIRINRPQLIPHVEQYKFLHDITQDYIKKNEIYSNFR